jgi:predicted nucleic acid-binding protein
MCSGDCKVPETAVADTGPPLHLAQIEQESQLTVFVRSSISEQVREELARRGVFDRIAAALGDRLVVESVTLSEIDAQRETLSSFRLHQTDLSVAALAVRCAPEVVLTDDLELRRGLEAHGHTVVGSVGVLVRAFKAGRYTKAALYAHLDRLFDGSTLYLSKGFRTHVRNLLDRLPE